jgi:hypothetical protein
VYGTPSKKPTQSTNRIKYPVEPLCSKLGKYIAREFFVK